MKFKPNYLLTFTVFISEIYISLIPLFVILSIIAEDTSNIFINILGIVLVTIVLFILINLLNIITLPFSKVKVQTFKNFFIHDNKEFKYTDIKEIEIEKGTVSKYGHGEPFTIILRKSPSELTFIERPSVILVLLLLLKCKGAKVKVKKWYTIFIWMLVFPLMMLVIYLITSISNK